MKPPSSRMGTVPMLLPKGMGSGEWSRIRMTLTDFHGKYEATFSSHLPVGALSRPASYPELHEARVAVVIHNHDAARNHRLFDFILEEKGKIEDSLGELIWERETATESPIYRHGFRTVPINDSPTALKEAEDWFVQTLPLRECSGRQLPTRYIGNVSITRDGHPTNRTVRSKRTSPWRHGGNQAKTGRRWEL